MVTMTEPIDETILLERARAGDQEAFAELLHPYRDRTWSVCIRVTGNQADAEDALQNALIAAWRNLSKFQGRSKFGTWLYRIAMNAANSLVRSRRETSVDMSGWEHLAKEVNDIDRVPEQDALRQAIDSLAPEFREALVLREIGQLSYAEIAEHSGVGIQTVKSRISRARRRAAEFLDDAGATG